MEHRIPINLTEQQQRDLAAGRPVRNLQTLVLEPARVETHYVYTQPTDTRRSTFSDNSYAKEYTRREHEEFKYGSAIGNNYNHINNKVKGLESLDDSFYDRLPGVAMETNDLFVEEEEDAQLYGRYTFRSEFDPNLSITGYKDQVLGMIERKQVSIVQGGTGCGKSTQVCQFILSDAIANGNHCNIVVTQPRRIATITVARRVCGENGWSMGSICGYQVGMEKQASNDTRILFCTIGVFLQKLISTKRMDEYTHVILDEVHDRGQDTDFCLLVVRKLMRTVPSKVKIILMSATLELPLYRKYLEFKTSSGNISEPSVITIIGNTYDVMEMYLDDLKLYGEVPELTFEPVVHGCLMKMAVNLILSFTSDERKKGVHRMGSVLVFLPGYEDIEQMKSMLEPHVEQHRLALRRLHSAVPSEEQANVFAELKDQRKVILATNIAESSITVADVKYVIDFCLTKSMVFNMLTNYSSLQLQWTSKSSCAQRRGRAGRVADGICYRLVEHRFYQTLRDFDTPEMLTSPLDHLVLKSKLLDMGSPKEVLALALTPPDIRNIEKTILILKEVGALSPLTPDIHDGELTFMGRVLAVLPVDIHVGKLILLGYAVGLLEETIIIGALQSVLSIFVHPSDLKLEAYQNKLKWSDGSMSDSLASYFAYKTWEQIKYSESFESRADELRWCMQHFLEVKRLGEVKILSEEIKRRLMKVFNIAIPKYDHRLDFHDHKNQILLKVILCGAFYPNYLISNDVDESYAAKEMCGHNAMKTVMVKGFPDGGVPFYKRHLKALFARCSPACVDIRVHGDHTKAFIEFNSMENKRSDIIAVCTAIKMRMLRIPLEVEYDSSELVLEEEDNRGGCGEFVFMARRTPPPTINSITIRITEIVECGHFWGSYCDLESQARNSKMHETIQEWVRRNRGAVVEETPIGSLCLAPFMDENNITLYYRSKVVARAPESAKVFYLDYGNVSELALTELYKLDRSFLIEPFKAMEFQLANIRPSAMNFNSWTENAKIYFESIVNSNASFQCEIFSIVNNIIRVRVFPTDHPDDDVGGLLIKKGFAEHCDESPGSKQNNALRTNRATSLQDLGCSLDEGVSNEQLFSKQNDTQPKTLDEVAKSMLLYKARQVKRLDKLKKVLISGPVNSYELKFHPLMITAGIAKVERDSVNSVIICDDPSDRTPYLMVAGFVGISQTRNDLVLRETSILPKIRGLSSLMTLLFAPKAEYRTNSERTRYTGALCGLGFYKDSPTNEAMFAENDLELMFDMTFTMEDLKMINEIRISLSLIIGEKMNFSESNLMRFQEAIRKKIFDLICKNRESFMPEPFSQSLVWNKIDKQHLIVTGLDDNDFFVPHDGVAMRPVDMDQRKGQHMTPEMKRVHHKQLVKHITRRDLDTSFHCLICNETLRGTARLASHLYLESHVNQLDPY